MDAAYLATAALLVLAILGVRHTRPSVSIPVVVLLLGAAGWNAVRWYRGPGDDDPSLAVAINVALVQVCAAMLYLTSRRLVRGRWKVPVWLWVVFGLILVLTFVGMLPQVGITDGERYQTSPVFLIHLAYSFGLLGAAVMRLSARQHDRSDHVRQCVLAAEVFALFVLTTQATLPDVTPFAVAVISLLMIWPTRRISEWSRSASRASRLLDSIGVFIFVVDREGRLQEWNGNAASLLELMGVTPEHGLDLGAALKIAPPFVDAQDVPLSVKDGMMRVSVTVHEVSPLAKDSDLVLMFRPVRTSVETSRFPAVSGALSGHDPATQTLGRKAALDQVQRAAENGRRIVRIDVSPVSTRRADDVMFVIARRLEARATEEAWPIEPIARLDTWSFVTTVTDQHAGAVPMSVVVDDLGVEVSSTPFTVRADESPAEFARRVSQRVPRTESAHGS